MGSDEARSIVTQHQMSGPEGSFFTPFKLLGRSETYSKGVANFAEVTCRIKFFGVWVWSDDVSQGLDRYTTNWR